MTEVKNTEARIKTFFITPKNAKIPVDGTTTDVTISGTVESYIENQIVDITLTHPNGKEETNPVHYAKTGTAKIFNFGWKYGVDKNKEIGTYQILAVLRENTDEKKSDTFEIRR